MLFTHTDHSDYFDKYFETSLVCTGTRETLRRGLPLRQGIILSISSKSRAYPRLNLIANNEITRQAFTVLQTRIFTLVLLVMVKKLGT